jgi:hypothetical protein
MAKGKAFLLVGHQNWGKSKTLTALTGGSHYVRKITIKGVEFFIRRTSNSDSEPSYLTFIKNVTAPNLIISFSSNFGNTAQILSILQSKYDLYFFVLECQYNNPAISIPGTEISQLKPHAAPPNIYSPKQSPAPTRAAAFRAYIESQLP